MVQLILKKYENDIATYECWIEGRNDNTFTISVNVKEEVITELSLPEENTYSSHAFHRVLDAYNTTKAIPLRTRSVWY